MNFAKLKKAELVFMSTHRCVHKHLYLQHPQCYTKDFPRHRRVGFLDIEANGLDASFGILLSWAIKVEGEKTIYSDLFRFEDIAAFKPGEEDRRIVESAVKAIREFDLLVTHYGNSFRFDTPFLRTRAVSLKLPFPEYGTLQQLDTYPILKSKFRMRSNRQEMAVRTLLGKTEKNHIIGWRWRAAARGDAGSLRYIMDHNLRDVRDLERLWHAISPYSAERGVSL